MLLVPVLEVVVIVVVSRLIGGWWTLGLLLAFTLAGAALVRREGSRTWSALRAAVNSGRMPARELADAALVLVGGLLMLTPGFVTDGIGLFLVLPFTRSVSRRLLSAVIGSRVLGATVSGPQQWAPPPDWSSGRPGEHPGSAPGSTPRWRPRPSREATPPTDDVIEGEIIRDDPPPQH